MGTAQSGPGHGNSPVWSERRLPGTGPSACPARISVAPEHTEEHMSSEGLDLSVQYIMMRGPYNIFSIKVTKSDLHFRHSRL